MEALELTDYDWIDDSDYNFKKDRSGVKKKGKVKDDHTIFVLSTLTFEQDTYIENEISRGAPDGDVAAACFHMGLKAVKNFKLKGKVIKFERDKDSDDEFPGDLKPWSNESLSRIGVLCRSRLQTQIRFGKEINGAERKN